MKPVDVKIIRILILIKKVMIKFLNFKLVTHIRISKYKNISAERYTPNWSEEFFVIKKLKFCFMDICY